MDLRGRIWKGKRSVPAGLALTVTGLCLICCAKQASFQGQHFPRLALKEGRGTILLFLVEDLQYYYPETGEISGAENLDYLINRLKMDLGRLSAEYPDMRILAVDVNQDRTAAIDFRVYQQIPTIILIDRAGYEVRRWLPDDFRRGGWTIGEIEKLLEPDTKPEP
ncbi:MAG: thioredoxin family protein [Fidelibacterota bacterium]|nr:MAG: thioredoxin family protein [Candidatus Neomarinimicrobiota bacterium]